MTSSAAAEEPGRVVLVSARPLFARGFGRLLGALRPALEIVARASLDELDAATRVASTAAGRPPVSSPDEDGTASLVLLDAAGLDAEALIGALELARGRALRLVVVLDETDDALAALAMGRGAAGVMVKAAPPGVLAEWLDALLAGERVRPAPSVTLDAESLSPALRRRLSARRQKLLRLQLGGHSIGETARLLGLTPSKVVTELRVVMDIVRGRGDRL